ncbi:MAG: hypothetical protein KAQ68_10555 [Clostridiales bacterium]|nr:hypothetical protein [Clostridiales bacterium]
MMNILQIAILIFTIIECGNIMMLYFNPGTRMANGIGVFNAWEQSKETPKVHDLIKYMINWVAGAKLIFIMIAIVVIIFGNHLTQLFTLVALILSILSFYWRLFPMIKKMDKDGEITPKDYSKTLFLMITAFVVGFTVVLVVALI